jgi:hypothetical protein
MSLSMRAEPVDPQWITGGFVLIPARQLLATWRACRLSPLGVADFRTWLACHEIVARRCTLDDERSPIYGFTELARLTGVSQKRVRASLNRLVAARLLAWSQQLIEFPQPPEFDDHTLADTIGGGQGSLAIPRRILRFLVHGARPALIATVLAILLRCLSRGRGGFKSRGRVKASWIARLFDVDIRRIKHARMELVALGWIAPEETEQWAENRWGRAFAIDLGWEPDGSHAGRRSPPPSAQSGRRLPPPDSDPEPLREIKNQEPAPGGPAGIEIRGSGGGPISPPTSPATAPLQPPVKRERETDSRRPAPVADGAGGGPLPLPRLEDVRLEDLKDTGRLLLLLEQAITRNLVSSSEADRLRFVGAAEHAMAVGKENPPGLFCHLIRGRLWRYLTQGDEDLASLRLKRHQFAVPGEVGVGDRSRSLGSARLSSDAELVGGVRAALIRAGIFRDAFPEFQARNPGWTRERWDGALSELGFS